MKEFLSHAAIKPISLIATIPSIAIAPVVDLKSVVWILVWLFLVDLFSGLCASYCVWLKTAEKGKYFFGQSGGFSSDKFMNGSIDELSIHNVDLTPTQISLIYNNGNGITL